MMQKKEIFEKYFKHDFLLLATDRVVNVRICVARTLRHHFLKEISGEFVFDNECNDAVRVLKLDKCDDVTFLVGDIETQANDNPITAESFKLLIQESRSSTGNDTDSSINSEDEQKIENEIKRHNS